MARISALYDEYLRKRPRQSRSRSVVEAILHAATEKISGGNEEEVAVHEVAARAGVGIGSLYDYFRDRQSLLSAFAAKVTEDNLRSFEALLETTPSMPLDEAIRTIASFSFATYTTNKRIPRAVLRIAHSINLMPAIARSQSVFAESLARTLKARTDVRVNDVDLAAWMITHATMGIIHTRIWDDSDEAFEDARLREEMVVLVHGYLSSATPAEKLA